MGRSAVLQDKVWPIPLLRKQRFKRNTIVCEDESWSLTYSGSTWRVDRYEYREHGRLMVFSGEGTQQMDIFLFPHLAWEDDPGQNIDDETRKIILRRITVALQWAGFCVGFFEMPSN